MKYLHGYSIDQYRIDVSRVISLNNNGSYLIIFLALMTRRNIEERIFKLKEEDPV